MKTPRHACAALFLSLSLVATTGCSSTPDPTPAPERAEAVPVLQDLPVIAFLFRDHPPRDLEREPADRSGAAEAVPMLGELPVLEFLFRRPEDRAR